MLLIPNPKQTRPVQMNKFFLHFLVANAGHGLKPMHNTPDLILLTLPITVKNVGS
jgi:hypothetical protein